MNGIAATTRTHTGSAAEILTVFLRLGLTCFGGPIAHLGYFRAEFVSRRRWLDETGYANLVGLCQFLPGPASSQVAFAIGLSRAGWFGALAAWLGFTLPSAILLVLFAYGSNWLSGQFGVGIMHGLKLAAAAVVAQAVFGMSRTLCPDRTRASLAVLATLLVLFLPVAAGQVSAIMVGAGLGFFFCRSAASLPNLGIQFAISRRLGAGALLGFFILLIGLPIAADGTGNGSLGLISAFYHAGALVFGGGHVVLPLLHDAVVTRGWVGDDSFLSGYGAAQAVPGPLFSFAAYLGAVSTVSPHGVLGAGICLAAIFLPGNLILVGALPFWGALQGRPGVQAAVRGVNASVVGLLAAALFSPIWIGSVHTSYDFAIALAAFVLLVAWKTAPLAVVGLCATAGLLVNL